MMIQGAKEFVPLTSPGSTWKQCRDPGPGREGGGTGFLKREVKEQGPVPQTPLGTTCPSQV